MTFLGIDIGTSAVKAVLVDEDESILADAVIPITTSYPEAGRVEQDPDQWWAATMVAIDDIQRADREGFLAMRGIGLSGQMHTTVFLDDADAIIRPALAWSDARAASACSLLERQVPDIESIAGSTAMAHYSAPRLLWLRENEPKNFARIARVLTAKDYVRFQLTGEYVTDASDAAGTLLFDERSREWSPALVSASGIAAGMLPAVMSAGAWSGMVRPELLAEWGIGHQVVVAAGAGDVAAAGIGIGAVRPGDAFISLDSVARLSVTRDAYNPPAKPTLNAFAHALPRRWFETTTPVNGTLCLDWLSGFLGERDIGRMISRVQETFAGPADLLFLPYLAGEQPPSSDVTARGAFAGLEAEHGHREMTQAVLEGVALAIKEAEEAFGDAFPSGPLPIVGEGSRSALFLLIVASVLDRPLLRVSNADIAAAFGAARLGRMAATGAGAEAVCVQPPLIEVVDPVPGLAGAYAEQRDGFRAFAQSLREVSEPREAKADRRRRAIR